VTKAAQMAKVSAKGSFNLLWGLVASTGISAVGAIYVANLLSPSEYGLYALAVAAPNLIGVFRDWGVNYALVKYTAQYNSEKQVEKTKKILVAGLVLEVAVGILLTVVSLLLSSFFAGLYQLSAITPLIQVVSFTILINAFFNVSQSAFIGFERMELNSVMLIIQSIVKAVFTPLLIVIGLGVFGATLGFTFSFLVAGVTGMLLLWILYRKLPNSPKQSISTADFSKGNIFEIKENAKHLFKYGLPLHIATIIGTFQTQFYVILMGIFAATDAVGNYSLATTFTVLITFIANPITTTLFPAFSKLDARRDEEALRSVFKFSVKYASLLVLPLVAIIMALAEPGISILFGNKYVDAPLFLTLLALNYGFTAFGGLSIGNLFSGQGKTALNLKLSILSAAIGFPLSIILAWQFGVTGILVTSIVAGIPGLIFSLHWIKKHYNLYLDWASAAKILFCSALGGAAAFVLQTNLFFSNLINLLVGIAVFVVVFLPSIILTRTLNRADVENLRQMATAIKPINRLLNPALNLIERLLIMVNRLEGASNASMEIEELPL
jgi:O-antigen/teichoic acid export membrane protein